MVKSIVVPTGAGPVDYVFDLYCTLSIFYKRQPENVTRVSLKFLKNLPRSVSKSVS